MTKFAFASDYDRPSLLQPPSNGRRINQDAFSRRMERLTSRRKDGRCAAMRTTPQHLDAMLLRETDALETAWRYEVAALIVQKKLRTPEADAIATTARTATALVVRRIEATRARTLDGLKVQARAALW